MAHKHFLPHPLLSLLCRSRSSDSAVSGLLKSSPEEVDAATSPIPPLSRPPPPPPPPHLYLKRGQQSRPKVSGSGYKGTTTLVHPSQPADAGGVAPTVAGGVLSRQISLHSLLEALPAASVDNDSSSEVAAAPPAAPSSSATAAVVTVGPHASSRNAGKKRASLSSLSLDSRSSDYDSYFYI